MVCKIQDYGLIGDCRAAALVSSYGSVDWLCWPRFDSPSIFAALVDPQQGGYWSICPLHPIRVERRYITDSNVLETRFFCATGQVTLTDLLLVASEEFKQENLLPDHELIRELMCIDGEVQVEIDFCPRADYGSRPVRFRHGLLAAPELFAG
jgi:GH15 family glucan-1,4-alpha-glucosidase